MSIRFKIALWFTALASLLLAGSAMVIYVFSVKAGMEVFNSRLRNRAWNSGTLISGDTARDYKMLRKLDSTSVMSLYNKSMVILDGRNLPVYQHADSVGQEISLSPAIIEEAKINEVYFFNYKGRKAVAVHFLDADQNFIIAMAAEDKDGETNGDRLRKIILTSLVITIVLSFAAGWLFAYRLLRPINRMATELGLITSNNLSQRIHTDNSKDELGRLASTCNLLLDRLQESFILQRRFISNASHELSTPLTSVSSQLEVALQNPRSAEEYRIVAASVYEDVKGLQQLTKSLLDIAKAGTEGSLELSEVRLDEVLLKVAADVKKLKEGYQVVIDIAQLPEDEKCLSVFGNENLLYIALKNIVENGCKYAHDNTAIIQAFFEANKILVSVRSISDVIAEADIEQVFQPFFRAEAARQKQGFGLGLTLSKRILALHKASLTVASNQQDGTIFYIEIANTA